jgi:hypothetical protein
MTILTIADSPSIRTDVPVDIHPDVLIGHAKSLDVESTIGRYVLADGRTALTTAYTAIGSLNDAVNSVKEASEPNGRVMKDGRKQLTFAVSEELVNATEKSFTRAARGIDARVDSLNTHIKALNIRVNAALDDPITKTVVATEVRAHFKAMKPDQRISFAVAAIESGDKATIAALLSAPAYLSGLDAKSHTFLRERSASKFAPTDHAQLGAANDVLTKVHAAGARLLARYAEVLGHRSTPTVKAAKQLRQLSEGK